VFAQGGEDVAAQKAALGLVWRVCHVSFHEWQRLFGRTGFEVRARAKVIDHDELRIESRGGEEIRLSFRPLLMVPEQFAAPDEKICFGGFRELFGQRVDQNLVIAVRARGRNGCKDKCGGEHAAQKKGSVDQSRHECSWNNAQHRQTMPASTAAFKSAARFRIYTPRQTCTSGQNNSRPPEIPSSQCRKLEAGG
jgi:hypothetical protein